MEESIISLIPDTMKNLDKVVEASEEQFLLLGQRLQSIYEKAGGLTDQTIASAEAVQKKEGSRLDQISDLAEKDIARLKFIQKTIQENTQVFPRALAHLGNLAIFLADIDRAARIVSTIALEFMAETARIGNLDKNFTVLANEIKELSRKTFGISDQIKLESREVKETFEGSQTLVIREIEHLAGLAQKAETSVEEAMNKIRELAALSVTSLESATGISKTINDQIGQIIVSLQMQDNISQRISHINQGFSDIQTLVLSDRPIGSSPYTPEQRTRMAFTIYRLQVSQLNLVITDLNQACQNNFEAFDRIAGQIGGLRQMFENTGTRENYARIFDGLSAGMAQLAAIREQGLSILAQFKIIADKSVSAGENLSRQVSLVRDISEDAHIKALNAIIAAHKLRRDGSVYNVLAMELKDRVTQISGLAENTEQTIARIADAAGEISTEPSGGSTKASFDKHRPQDLLAFLYQSLAGQMDAVVSGCALLTGSIKETVLGLEAMGLLSKSLEDARAELGPLEEYFSSLGEPADEFLFNDPYFYERYTMASERLVHRDVLEQDGSDSLDTDALEQSGSGDGLGDNIEFF
ncbi:hypothetical protein [Desulfobacter sp.]|uniref:hypothetical protein n=1 Tax=Desulfobacter sp. TaxID=2294 RepID=UPI003D0BC675